MMLEPSIRQKAMVGPGTPAFLMIVELALNVSTTATIATSPIGAGVSNRTVRTTHVVGCRRMSGSM